MGPARARGMVKMAAAAEQLPANINFSAFAKATALKKEGESGRKKLNQYTRYGTVGLAAVQAYGIAVGIEGLRGPSGLAVMDPGIFFRITTLVTLTGGTVFLMWLGEQITARGVGNG